jgi:hypothetical protein
LGVSSKVEELLRLLPLFAMQRLFTGKRLPVSDNAEFAIQNVRIMMDTRKWATANIGLVEELFLSASKTEYQEESFRQGESIPLGILLDALVDASPRGMVA